MEVCINKQLEPEITVLYNLKYCNGHYCVAYINDNGNIIVNIHISVNCVLRKITDSLPVDL